jgi:tyrosyl-tRNA synthetase
MGGDLKKIQTVGRYMIEVWRAAGMDMTNVEFIWASQAINAAPNDYWLRVMDIARKFNVTRVRAVVWRLLLKAASQVTP